MPSFIRTFPLSLLVVGLCLGCDNGSSEESDDTEDAESFSTTFPPVTTTSATTTGTDSDPGTSGTSSDTSTTTGPSGTDDGSSSDTGTEGDGSTGDASDPLAALSDEFDDAGTLSNWTLKHEAEGLSPDHSLLDIAETEDGKLTVRPNAGGWFDDTTGFLMYVELDGDFLVETHVNAGSLIDTDQPPTRPYNSGGLLVRSPNFGPGDENWVTHNLGYQLESVATEGKTTTDSVSTLELIDGPNAGVLRMCKVGSQFVLTRRLDNEASFTQTHTFNRGDLTGTLQVGVVVGGWNATGSAPNLMVTPDIEARFDYVRFRSISAADECLDP